MKKVLKIIFLILFTGFVAIQFIRPDFTNPPVDAADKIESSMLIPENVQKILTVSCKDCHSNETIYPWYTKIQPAAQFLKDHIETGRRELNFSVWNTYDLRRKKRKLEEICEQSEINEMPLPSYLWIHRDARLAAADVKVLCDWTNAEAAKLENVN